MSGIKNINMEAKEEYKENLENKSHDAELKTLVAKVKNLKSEVQIIQANTRISNTAIRFTQKKLEYLKRKVEYLISFPPKYKIGEMIDNRYQVKDLKLNSHKDSVITSFKYVYELVYKYNDKFKGSFTEKEIEELCQKR